MNRCRWLLVLAAPTLMTTALLAQAPKQPPGKKLAPPTQPPRNADAVAEAQTPRQVEIKRPEQRTTDHDRRRAIVCEDRNADFTSAEKSAESGPHHWFDFYVDPLGADRPGITLKEVMENESAARPKVNADQRNCSKAATI